MNDNNQTYKADSGKTRLDLVSPTFIEAVGQIRTFGVQKYGDGDSWTKVEPQRYMAALLRHINAYRMGEALDKESGMPHLWHAACNLMFLIELEPIPLAGFGEGDTPLKYNPSQKTCLNCALFGTCKNYVIKAVTQEGCNKWQSDRVEETKAAISALPDTPPKDNKSSSLCTPTRKSCLNCALVYDCDKKPKNESVFCSEWEYNF